MPADLFPQGPWGRVSLLGQLLRSPPDGFLVAGESFPLPNVQAPAPSLSDLNGALVTPADAFGLLHTGKLDLNHPSLTMLYHTVACSPWSRGQPLPSSLRRLRWTQLGTGEGGERHPGGERWHSLGHISY